MQTSSRDDRAIPIPTTVTVNQLTREYPATLEVFSVFGIDTCCGGAVPVAEAAERDGANVSALLDALADTIAANAG